MKALTEQAQLAISEAAEAGPRGHSAPRHNSDGLAVTYVTRPWKWPIVIWHSQDLIQ